MVSERERTSEGMKILEKGLEKRKTIEKTEKEKQLEQLKNETSRCDECGGILEYDISRGEYVCKACGMVVEESMVEGSIGQYLNFGDIAKGYGGSMGSIGGTALGTQPPPRHVSTSSHSIIRSSVKEQKTQEERVSVETYNFLKKLITKLQLPNTVLNIAKGYFLQYYKQFEVNNLNLYATAALYLTVNIPHSGTTYKPQVYQRDMRDFVNASGFTDKQIFTAYKNIKSVIFSEQKHSAVIKTTPQAIAPSLLPKVLRQEIISQNQKIVTEILNLLDEASRYMDDNKIYKQARGIVATAFYLILSNKYKLVSKDKIVKELQVSWTTIKNNATWMKDLMNNNLSKERKTKKSNIKYKKSKIQKRNVKPKPTNKRNKSMERKSTKQNKIFDSMAKFTGIGKLKPIKISLK